MAVHAEGCEIEVLRQRAAPGTWTTDCNRPALRQCVSEGCPGLLRCTTKFAG